MGRRATSSSRRSVCSPPVIASSQASVRGCAAISSSASSGASAARWPGPTKSSPGSASAYARSKHRRKEPTVEASACAGLIKFLTRGTLISAPRHLHLRWRAGRLPSLARSASPRGWPAGRGGGRRVVRGPRNQTNPRSRFRSIGQRFERGDCQIAESSACDPAPIGPRPLHPAAQAGAGIPTVAWTLESIG